MLFVVGTLKQWSFPTFILGYKIRRTIDIMMMDDS